MFRLSTREEFKEILDNPKKTEKLVNELAEYVMMHPYPDDMSDRGVIRTILNYLADR